MTPFWALTAIIVLMAVLAATRLLRRLVFAFAIAAAILLLLHARENPGEALPVLAVLGGGTVLGRPIRRLVGGFVGGLT